MPLPFFINKKMAKLWDDDDKGNKVSAKKEEILILFYDPTSFKTEIYLSVTGSVPNAKNVGISGEFMSKVYDGSYKEVPKFIKAMDGYLDNKGKKAERYYIQYSYCPKCSKRYGHNYMTFFAKVK